MQVTTADGMTMRRLALNARSFGRNDQTRVGAITPEDFSKSSGLRLNRKRLFEHIRPRAVP